MKKFYNVLLKPVFGSCNWQRFLIIAFLFVVLPAVVFSQSQRVIKGTVTDEKNEPLPGVSVLVVGSNNGVASDVNGKYSITVSSNNNVLRFTSVGFTTKEIPV